VSLLVLLGGARSGKSTLAIRLAVESEAPVTFVATGEARDAEMAARIDQHRLERPGGWTTVEEPLDLLGSVRRARAGTLVVDCLSLWAANALEHGLDVEGHGADAAGAAAGRAGLTIAVTNEVGLGVVPATALGRRYRDVLGRVNAAWVAAAERALLVVAGRVLELKEPA
jgi:adenosyl cobinamide kinase/adenosyl cobinamide phosphate guanylyltransferase